MDRLTSSSPTYVLSAMTMTVIETIWWIAMILLWTREVIMYTNRVFRLVAGFLPLFQISLQTKYSNEKYSVHLISTPFDYHFQSQTTGVSLYVNRIMCRTRDWSLRRSHPTDPGTERADSPATTGDRGRQTAVCLTCENLFFFSFQRNK